jgi:hypothetical protein
MAAVFRLHCRAAQRLANRFAEAQELRTPVGPNPQPRLGSG